MMDDVRKPAELLPGKVTVRVSSHGSEFLRNEVAVLAEHDLRPHVDTTHAAYVIVPRSVLADQPLLADVIHAELFRRLQPWLDPDRPTWPSFVPFPRLARLERWLRAQRERVATW